jgi:HlyD family type I secretion membrane fusion protein
MSSQKLQPTTGSEKKPNSFSIGKHIVFATSAMALLIFGFGGWAAMANLTGAVVAPGMFMVEGNVKKVQHSFGGIVSEINVRNGDRVKIGQILMKLDDTQIRAELGIIRLQITELTARSARLGAEGSGLSKVEFPAGFLEQNPSAKAAVDGEIRLFEGTRQTKDSQKEQLALKIEQSKNEITGMSAQRDAKAGELKLIKKELVQIRGLFAKKLTTQSQVFAMEREEMRLAGEIGGFVAQIARAKGQISEINVQILAVDENVRAQAQRELRTVEAKLSELSEREVAVKDKLARVDLRAPRSGVVLELAVHTVGGVVSPAEPVMLIVPEEEGLMIMARISPPDIDQVVAGGKAKLRLSAFDQKTTPELDGHVIDVAADVTIDPKNGQNYYNVRLEMDEKDRHTVGDLTLVAGMPVEVFISTGDRTALSYLTKPFVDQVNRAFRE